MRIGPSAKLPSNLTIVLIERDRANPVPAEHRSLRRLKATRMAVSRQARYAPEPIPCPSAGRTPDCPKPDRHTSEAATAAPFCDARPDEPRKPYHPHRIPDCELPYNAQKSHERPADPFQRLLDLYG